jgi:hypothetical protein
MHSTLESAFAAAYVEDRMRQADASRVARAARRETPRSTSPRAVDSGITTPLSSGTGIDAIGHARPASPGPPRRRRTDARPTRRAVHACWRRRGGYAAWNAGARPPARRTARQAVERVLPKSSLTVCPPAR